MENFFPLLNYRILKLKGKLFAFDKIYAILLYIKKELKMKKFVNYVKLNDLYCIISRKEE